MEHQSAKKQQNSRSFWKEKKARKQKRDQEKKAKARIERQEALSKLTEEERLEVKEESDRRRLEREEAEAWGGVLSDAALEDRRTPSIVFDLSFAWCMTPADTRSTVAQIKYAYSTLRHTNFLFRPVITSVMGKEESEEREIDTEVTELLQPLRNFEGFKRFPPLVTDAHWSDCIEEDNIVFLTADAEETLETIEPGVTYVIGAFVDHNRYKNLSYNAAKRHGVRTAKLPIKENIVLGDRCKVLTINHMTEVLVRYLIHRDWRVALEGTLPSRRNKES